MSAVLLPRKQVTRDEFLQLLDSDVFEGRRYELIEGELIDKMGQKPPHASTIRRVLRLLVQILGIDRVLVQAPVEVAIADRKRNFPEPDLAFVREAKPDYEERHPNGDELLLAVEVADRSLRMDAKTKLDLYARAGVPEYWIIDLPSRRLIIHRTPVEGAYQQILTLAEGEIASLESAPDAAIRVGSLLPPA